MQILSKALCNEQVIKQRQLLDGQGRGLSGVGFCFQEYVEERISLLRETEQLLRHLASRLDLTLPEALPLNAADATHDNAEAEDGNDCEEIGLVDLSDMVAGGGGCIGGGVGTGEDVMASFFGGSADTPPDIMAMLAPRTEEEMAAAIADEEAREKETSEFNLSFDSALASFTGNVDIKFDESV
jgi:hypothetical protein